MIVDELDELDAFGDDELLDVLVNYHRSALGAWSETLAPEGLEPVTVQATSAHDASPKRWTSSKRCLCMRTWRSRPCTPWTANLIAWAMLAAREGFVDCAITDPTLAGLITHD